MIGELSPNHLAGESTCLVGLAPSQYLALTLARRTHLWFKAGVHWTTHPAGESTRLVGLAPSRYLALTLACCTHFGFHLTSVAPPTSLASLLAQLRVGFFLVPGSRFRPHFHARARHAKPPSRDLRGGFLCGLAHFPNNPGVEAGSLAGVQPST